MLRRPVFSFLKEKLQSRTRRAEPAVNTFFLKVAAIMEYLEIAIVIVLVTLHMVLGKLCGGSAAGAMDLVPM